MKTSHFDSVSIEVFNRHLRNVTLFILVVFGVLILRLWFLQIVNGTTYRIKSENNRIRLQDIPPFRGVILDRGSELLVGNRPSYDLYVIPEDVKDLDHLLESLNQLAGLDPASMSRKLGASSRRYPFRPVCLKRDISRRELAMIETRIFNLPGVMIKVRPQRYYVFKNFASHILGYLGEIDDHQLRGGKIP